MDETAGDGDPTPPPGWLDDPFHRSGQRWWDGQQWTARTRTSPGASSLRDGAASRSRSAPRGAAPTRAGGRDAVPAPRPRVSLRPYALVVAGVLLVFSVVGLVAPSAEESGAAADGYPRAAYWACADLLSQRLGPSVELEFPGESTATLSHDGPTWDVRGLVEILGDQQPVVRDWTCTVTHDDDGAWRGTAALE